MPLSTPYPRWPRDSILGTTTAGETAATQNLFKTNCYMAPTFRIASVPYQNGSLKISRCWFFLHLLTIQHLC